jgi:hypothetical protein
VARLEGRGVGASAGRRDIQASGSSDGELTQSGLSLVKESEIDCR